MNENLFKDINGYPLDEEQKKAAMSNARFSMIIAGAGSGKTLTMIGRIKYLLHVKNIAPEDIICISFTNEAVNSLKKKINNEKIKAFTFHKFAIYLLEKEDIFYEFPPENYLSTVVDHFFELSSTFTPFLKKQVKKVFRIQKVTAKTIKTSPTYLVNKKYILSFINLYNAHNLSASDLKRMLGKKESSLLFLIYAIIPFYEKQKTENHYFDFDDLIKEATKICQKKNFSFQELIIDEFQDTSLLRLQFIKTIIDHSNANLTVVGDDFQSIYKFSGCDLDIFLNFQKFFPNTEVYRIQTTYRNSKELIELAGNFVMKNKKQIKKVLKSNISLKDPVQLIYYFNRFSALKKAIKKIQSGEILILGRNNFDIYKFIPKDKILWLENGYFKIENEEKELRYLTIHKSKGLESENVIILNLENNILGFPSQKKNHSIFEQIEKKEDFLFEEERRLFYVALTRTKNYCYLLVPNLNKSVFVKEIKKML